MRNIKYETRKVADLIPYVNNARTHSDEQITQLASSIQEFGFINPVIIDDHNGLIAGHGRLMAAKKLGLEEVPVLVESHLTEAQKKAYILADNKLALNAGWDADLLQVELSELKDLGFDNLDTIGFSDDEINNILNTEPEAVEDEGAGEIPEEPKSQRGDIWILGEHRLMCGDSTSENDVKCLMLEEKADLVFTDPPYRMGKGGPEGDSSIGKCLRKQERAIAFISDFNPSGFLKVLPSVFSKNTFNAYIFCNKELLPDYLNWAVENKLAFNVLIWKKPSTIPIGYCHRPDIEYLLFFRKSAIWHSALKGVNYSRCLEFGRESGLHPTMKPIGLIANELQISSNKDSVILDFFGGSGSTLIACEQLKRKCRMMELDEHYCDVIMQRWQKLTGKEAVRIDGVKFSEV